MELQITQHQNGEITFNSQELRKQIIDYCDQYNGLVYTDENIKDAKKDRTEVRKKITAIEDRRKEIKRVYMDSYTKFEREVKDCLSPLVELEGNLKTLADDYERRRKEAKLEEIKKIYEEVEFPFTVPLEAILQDEWFKVSYSPKAIKDDMVGEANNLSANMKALEKLPNGFEAVEIYKETLDMTRALNEADRLARIQALKEEAKAEEEEREKQLSKETDKLYTATFTVTGTILQLKALKAYMDKIEVIIEE